MERSIAPTVLSDLNRKMVLIGGPRQVGKTTLSKSLYPQNSDYLTYDFSEDRKIILKKNWNRKQDLLILDELHKMKAWKTWLKGIYDKEGNRPRILVTGSARLDTYKKGSDSMAGRFFYFRLHPLSLAELKKSQYLQNPTLCFERLLDVGGFPEPFFDHPDMKIRVSEDRGKVSNPSSLFARVPPHPEERGLPVLDKNQILEFPARWRRNHLDRILKEDLLDLEQIRELKNLEVLVDLLSDRVGSTISASSLAEDLQVAPHTVQRWIQILERLMVIFVVTPFSKNIARAIKKEPKIYFYDNGRVKADPAARLENLVACSLLKRLHYLEDTRGENCELVYLRDKEKREVDFLTIRNRKPEWLIEVKLSEANLSPSLMSFSTYFKEAQLIQLVKNINYTRQQGPILLAQACDWLSQLES